MLTCIKKHDSNKDIYYEIGLINWYWFYLPKLGLVAGYIIMPGPVINNKYIKTCRGYFPFYPLNTQKGFTTLGSHFAKFVDATIINNLNKLGFGISPIGNYEFKLVVNKK